MKQSSKNKFAIILTLSFLTSLEPLSIDLFLPGFTQIAQHFRATPTDVQLSLSTFLGGFAIGQLIWGPLSDRYGRKNPLLLSLLIFSLTSVLCAYVSSIEQLWLMRFLQAMGGCGSIVISRSIVTDYFDKTQTLSIFAILALIMGIAPIVAPIIGNQLIKYGGWKITFEGMAILGAFGLIASFTLLPETLHKENRSTPGTDTDLLGIWHSYAKVLKVKQFVVYSLVAGLVNGALMVYIGNAPFLIMEVGGYSGDVFSIIFATNALGMMLSAYLTSKLQYKYSSKTIVVFASIWMCLVGGIFVFFAFLEVSVPTLLTVLFLYVFPMGMLFPTTTDLAMSPFASGSSGAASSMFGALQLGIAFLTTMLAGKFSGGSLVDSGLTILLPAMLIIPLLRYYKYHSVKHING